MTAFPLGRQRATKPSRHVETGQRHAEELDLPLTPSPKAGLRQSQCFT
jgi:hypothetical protein